MANHISAVKRARQNTRREARNRAAKSALKSFEKAVRTACAQKDTKTATEALREMVSKFDKAASKGIIQAGKASRKASRLSKLVADLK